METEARARGKNNPVACLYRRNPCPEERDSGSTGCLPLLYLIWPDQMR